MSSLRLLAIGVLLVVAACALCELLGAPRCPGCSACLPTGQAPAVGTRLDAPLDTGTATSIALAPNATAETKSAGEATAPTEFSNVSDPARSRAPEFARDVSAVDAASVPPAEAADVPAAGATPASPADAQQPRKLDFDVLGRFDYVEPDPDKPESYDKAAASIPAALKALDGKLVSIRGYMLPLEYAGEDGRQVSSFLLSRAFIAGCCCFGAPPKINELIHVSMEKGKNVPYDRFSRVTVTGALRVGVDKTRRTALVYTMPSPKVEMEDEDAER